MRLSGGAYIQSRYSRAVTANLDVREIGGRRAVDVARRIGPGEDEVVSALANREILHRFRNSNERRLGIADFAARGGEEKEEREDRQSLDI